MKKNKFYIGQKVIVIQDGKVVEKIVDGISSHGEELAYELINPPVKTTYYGIKSLSIGVDPSNVNSKPVIGIMDFAREYFENPIRNWGHGSVISANDYDNEFMESEIFENEADFRANVKIEFIQPTKKENIEALKQFAISDPELPAEVASLIGKIHGK